MDRPRGSQISRALHLSLCNLCVLCVSVVEALLTTETQRSRAATKLFLKYAEGVRKFQPRVGAGDNPGKQD